MTGQAPETFLHKVVAAPPVEDVPVPADDEALPADDEALPDDEYEAPPVEAPIAVEPQATPPGPDRDSPPGADRDSPPGPDRDSPPGPDRDSLLGPAADELMVRWRRAVSAFVDDPPAAYAAGTEVVGAALTQIQAALRARQQDSRDTEVLRQAMLRQRRLLDGLLEM